MAIKTFLHRRTIGILAALLWQMLLQISTDPAQSFVIRSNVARPSCLMAQRKPSMAQRRKSRAKRLQAPGSPSSLPPRLPLASVSGTPAAEPSSSAAPSTVLDDTKSKAKQLLESQRKSIEMLNFFRQRVERLDAGAVAAALESRGYYCIDQFLEDSDVIYSLAQEGHSLLDQELMQADVDRIGSGEYLCSIEGGVDQYPKCPRSIELVVALTRHFPGDLDKSKTMASMRTFSRSAWLASLQLLTGSSDGADEAMPVPRDFRAVRSDTETDARRVSMVYFAVPSSWENGGDLVFKGETDEVVSATRDRLVVWKSDLPYRQDAFKGSDALPLASCLELHLIK